MDFGTGDVESQVIQVSMRLLREGMVLAADILTPEGTRIVPEAAAVTPVILGRLQALGSDRIALPIQVYEVEARAVNRLEPAA